MARTPNVSKQTALLLATLLESPAAWRHGYGISQITGFKSGTLYPLLMRLEEQGFLESKWQETERPGGPPRHVYRLTGSGRALARERKSTVLGKTPRKLGRAT
jgi:PadR family transcriptional regulator, regulatory protein PadR